MFSTTYTKEQLELAVKSSYSIAGVLRALNLAQHGGNYKTIKKYIKLWNLDTSHFTGQGHLKNKTHNWSPSIALKDILVEYSTYNTYKLKKRLVNEKMLEHRCKCCGITEWLNKPIPLELDHINGINTDHRLENLQILCPNCHSQTINHRGKNKKKKKYIKHKWQNKCQICQKICKSKFCSVKCYNKHRPFVTYGVNRKVERPPLNVLIKDTQELGFLQTGKKYGVTDNCIRKWIKVETKNQLSKNLEAVIKSQ